MPEVTAKPIALPTVNNNGTTRKELRDQYLDVITAARELREFLLRAAPHGRDYLLATDRDALFNQAATEHAARVVWLEGMIKDYEKLVRHVRK